MASSTNSNGSKMRIEKTPVEVVDPRSGAQPGSSLLLDISLVQRHPDFVNVIGTDPRHALLLSSADASQNPFFHGGCARVWENAKSWTRDSDAPDLGDKEVLYVTSNALPTSSSSQIPAILISRIILERNADNEITAADWHKLRPPPGIAMPAGVIPYSMPASGQSRSSSGVLYCAQGNLSPGTSGLVYMPGGKPPRAMVTNYYGRDFNSVYGVVQGPDGCLWFTDPCHGFDWGFRQRPQMPCHVYRFDPASAELRVVVDDLKRPTGICFSPDAQTAYITDADSLHGDGAQDRTRAATVYAFDVLQRNGSVFLANKHVFAYVPHGVPMGVQCDAAGNVYVGCTDGVEVWNAGGVLLGVIQTLHGASSFSICGNEMFLCSEQELWWVQFGSGTEPPTTAPMMVDTGDDPVETKQ